MRNTTQTSHMCLSHIIMCTCACHSTQMEPDEEPTCLMCTSPCPRLLDVARKALILARSLGWSLSMSDISIEPLFPPSFANLAVPDFLKALPQLDEEYAKRCDEAHKQGKVLRYVANIQEHKITVGLQVGTTRGRGKDRDRREGEGGGVARTSTMQ